MARGGGLRAAMGVRVPVKDVLTEEVAICHVLGTYSEQVRFSFIQNYRELNTNLLPSMSSNMAEVPQDSFLGSWKNLTPRCFRESVV
jgi:hypothetical protein